MLYNSNIQGINKIEFIFEIAENENTNIDHFDYEITRSLILFGPGEAGGWREELYRQAYLDSYFGNANSFEQRELLTFWREIYDPDNKDWKSSEGWNPNVRDDPSQLSYWLDYIDLPEYSVSAIGRRSKAINDDKINNLWIPRIPEVIFYDIYEREKYINIINDGYQAFQLSPGDSELFINSSTKETALDIIKSALRSNLNYNIQLSITCLPLYHLEPNTLIQIYGQQIGIYDQYLATQFTLPLTHNGTMSITATQILNQY